MGMSDDVWTLHASPQSGWSRDWIGWWSLLAVILVCLWTWANPRVFQGPESTGSWMSKAVLGERISLDKDRTSTVGQY